MNPMHAFRSLRRYAGKLQTLRNQVRTQRALDALPPHLQKDIGWPDAVTRLEDRLH